MGMFNFLKNPFERLTAENQEDLKKSMDSVAESLTDRGPIFTKLDSIDKKLESVSTILGDISKKLNVKGRVKADAKEMKQMGETAKAMGQGMQWFVQAIEGFSKIEDSTVEKFVLAIERIGEAFKNMEKTASIIEKASKILINMAAGIILFGLALLIALPIYVLAIPGAIIAIAVISGFMYLFSKVLGDDKNTQKIHDGVESLAMMGVAVILFGIAMLLVGVGVYTKLITVGSVVIFGVMLAFIVLFAYALGKVFKDDISSGAKSLALMGVAVILFGLALLLSIPIYKAIMEAPGAVGSMILMAVVIGAVVGIFFLLDKIKGNIKDGAVSMFIMAGTILLLGLAIWAFGKLISMIDNPWETMATAGIALLGLAGIMIVVGKIKGDVVKGSLGMIIATGALLALGLALWVWKKLDIDSATTFLAGIALTGLAITMAAAGEMKSEIIKGSLVMTLASLPLFALGLSLGYFQKQEIGWETLGIVGAAIIGLGAAMALAGIGFVFIGLGSAAMLIAGAAVIAIGYGLQTFKKSDIDMNIIDTASYSITTLGTAMAGVGFVSPLIGLGSISMIGAGLAIITIGEGLSIFKKIDFGPSDADNFKTAINTVISTFTGISFKDSLNMAVGVAALSGVGNIMTSLAGGIQSFANMKFIEYEVVKDPKTGQTRIQPKSIVELSDSKIEAAGINFGKVISAIIKPISEVGLMESVGSGFFSGNFVSKGISALTGIGGIMTDMARGIQDLANLTFTKWEIFTDTKTGEKKIQPSEILKLSDGDFTAAGIGFGKIIGAIVEPLATVGREESNSSGLFSDGNVSKGILALTGIGNIMSGMAEGISKLANMEFVTQEIYRDPKTGQTKIQPGKIVKLSVAQIQSAQANFSLITNSMLGAIINAGKQIEVNEDSVEKLMDHQENILKLIKGFSTFAVDWSKIANPITLGTSFEYFTKSIMNVFDPKKNPTNNLIYFNIFADKMSILGKSSSEFEKIADSFERIADSMGDFKENLNGLDKDILTETKGLFDAMAIISKSDTGDKFLKKYSDSLKTTFEKLHSLLEDFKGSVDNNTETQKQAVKVAAAPKPQPPAPGLKAQPMQPQQVDMSGVINAINQLKTVLTSQGIKVKKDTFE